MNFFKVTAAFALLVASAAARPQIGSDLLLADFNAQIAEEPFNPNPVYAYTYQVADDTEQTYISHQESRDGEDVQGQYSYVDATGALVTVTYTAGVMGYTESRKVEPNFVTIRARPAKAVVAAAAPAPVQVQEVIQQIQPAIQTVVTETTGSSADSDLVAQIIAKLSPFIKETVTSSLGASSTGSSSSTTTTTSSGSGSLGLSGIGATGGRTITRTITRPAVTRTAVVPAAPIILDAVQPAQSATAAIFGVGGPNNVQFETPDFEFAYDLSK